MFEFTIGGRKIRPEDFEQELGKVAAKHVADELHARISSIRHPSTGEFPVVVAIADSLDHIDIRVEGSPELIALIRERLSEDDLEHISLSETEKRRPHAFLSYASEDRELAERIAKTLQANGVDTWWAEWSIQAGDSLRQKIEEGLTNCTHFLVLLTPSSIGKKWVNLEIDAGLVRKVETQARFIPLRCGLPASALPPLLKTMSSPAVDDFDQDITKLVNDIHNVLKKPPLGPAPISNNVGNSGYSPAANKVAQLFVQESETENGFDPRFGHEELAERTGLPEEDLADALHELRNFLTDEHWWVTAKDELFVEFDSYVMAWKPADDALRLATDLLNDADFPGEPSLIAEHYGWSPRRLNPAINYLANRKLAEVRTGVGMQQWAAFHIERNDATRRYVRSRS